jgi:leader peptidase (prepilin peptidase) / N-methyltransferase
VSTFGVVVVGLFGLLFGSFFNVCIARLPAGVSVVTPPSRCPSCRARILWYDNVPVLSYVLLGGRCRSCRARISLRYPAVEVATAVLFVTQALAFGDDPVLLAHRLVLTSTLIVLFGTDLETQRLPNVITLPGLGVGLVWSLFVPPGFAAAALGAALGAGVLLAIRWIWLRASGVEGMGLGDVKMLALVGAFLGWQQVIVVLFLASLAGAVIGVILAAVGGRSLQSRLPFGTFIALAAFVASLVGPDLVRWYLDFYR